MTAGIQPRGDLTEDLRKIAVERMGPADIYNIAALEARCFTDPWSSDSLREELFNDNAYFYVSFNDTVFSGYAGSFITADECYLSDVAVSEEFRRSGTATELLSTIITNARAHGCRFVSLEVRQSNAQAIGLYQRMGFTKQGVRKSFYTDPCEDGDIMTLFFTDDENDEKDDI